MMVLRLSFDNEWVAAVPSALTCAHAAYASRPDAKLDCCEVVKAASRRALGAVAPRRSRAPAIAGRLAAVFAAARSMRASLARSWAKHRRPMKGSCSKPSREGHRSPVRPLTTHFGSALPGKSVLRPS